MISVISQTTFQDQSQQNGGQAPKSQGNDDDTNGWPIKWQPPYWFAQQNEQKYNPYLRIIQAESDGFVKWYDPTNNTYWRQHPSGAQEGLMSGGVVHTYPTKHSYSVGGGGNQTMHGGYHDVTHTQHVRTNYHQDSYTNHGGKSHGFSTGGVQVTAGNSKHVITGNHHTEMAGSGSAWGVGVGSNSPQDASISMTSKRVMIATQMGAGAGGSGLGGSSGSQGQTLSGAGAGTTSGDIWMVSKQSDLAFYASKNGKITCQSGSMQITAQGGDVTIRGAKNISMVPGSGGSVQIQGNMNVQGTATIQALNAPSANISNLYVTNGSTGGSPSPSVSIASNYGLSSGGSYTS